MIKLILVSFMACFLLTFEANSQGFAHIYQTPLLLNPSFAGSTGGIRLAVATNFGNYGSQNNYLSFDHLLPKTGLGIGGAVFSNKGQYYYNLNQSVGGLIAIAPKYVLKRSDGSKRATLSPSLSVRYSMAAGQDEWRDYSGTNPSTDPSFRRPYDIGFINENNNYSKDLKLSAGLLYNSEKLMLGLVFSNRWLEQRYDVYKMFDDSSSMKYPSANSWSVVNGIQVPADTSQPYFTEFYGKKQASKTFKVSIQTLDFHFSKMIKLGSAKFSIVPSLLVGFAYYKRAVIGGYKSYGDFSLYKRNLSLQLNYGKIFLGGGVAGGTDSYFLFAGFKNERIKVMGSYNFLTQTFPTVDPVRSFELSVNYNFKSRKR